MIRTLFADRARDETVAEVCSRAAGHGFAGVGAAIGERGPVSFSSTASEIETWRGEAVSRGVRIAALSLDPASGRFTAQIAAPAEGPALVRAAVTGRAVRMQEVPVLARRTAYVLVGREPVPEVELLAEPIEINGRE